MKILILILAFCSQAFGADILGVYFSPNGGAEAAITNQIAQAKTQILIQAYSFTSKPIAAALIDAKKRGVDVQVIIDESSFETSVHSQLSDAGIKVFMDDKHALAHAKIIIYDGKIVSEGSYNFSANANLRNSECLLFIQDPDVAKKFLDNFQVHLNHSVSK